MIITNNIFKIITFCCLPSTHSVTEAQMLPLCFLNASLASALLIVPVRMVKMILMKMLVNVLLLMITLIPTDCVFFCLVTHIAGQSHHLL